MCVCVSVCLSYFLFSCNQSKSLSHRSTVRQTKPRVMTDEQLESKTSKENKIVTVILTMTMKMTTIMRTINFKQNKFMTLKMKFKIGNF